MSFKVTVRTTNRQYFDEYTTRETPGEALEESLKRMAEDIAGLEIDKIEIENQ